MRFPVQWACQTKFLKIRICTEVMEKCIWRLGMQFISDNGAKQGSPLLWTATFQPFRICFPACS